VTPIFFALVVGALGAALGPTLARAASVLHRRLPSARDLSPGLRRRTPFRPCELAPAAPDALSPAARLGDLGERGDQRLERRRIAGCVVACACLFTLAARHWGGTVLLVPYLLLFAVLVVVALVDLEHCLIPDRVVFPSLGLSIIATTVASVLDGRPAALAWATLGAVAFCACLLAVHLLNPAGMGFGDVKVALLLGWFLGWSAADVGDALGRVLVALLAASLAGSLVGLVALARRGRGAHYPFGPWLALGVVAVLLLTPAVPG
jgi:leader peptidase (prepilin peptidase)/N-methyltransferase